MNEMEFLPMSVASVIDSVDEIVLINNRSTDGTYEWMLELQSQHPNRVKVVNMDSIFDEKTEFQTRNEALSHCSHEWILALDADQIMADNWLKAVRPLMLNPKYECIGIRYIHLVGSFEYEHAPSVGVGKHVWCFFRNTPHLKCRPASEVCEWAKPFHHASHERSCSPGSLIATDETALWHLGFCKRNAMWMTQYRVGRGDSGHEPEKKAELIKQLQDSGNPFLFCGPVVRVPYGKESVPAVMRDKFDTTYRLVIDTNGQIKDRIVIATGERG